MMDFASLWRGVPSFRLQIRLRDILRVQLAHYVGLEGRVELSAEQRVEIDGREECALHDVSRASCGGSHALGFGDR